VRAFLARTALLITLLLSVVWLCRTPDWEPLIATFTAFCAYLGLDVWKTFIRLSQHDKRLLSAFRELLPSDSRAVVFLRQDDVAVPFKYTALRPLQEFVATWNSADYEFDDRRLEKARNNFYTSLSQFLDMLSIQTYPSDKKLDWQTMDFRDFEDRPEKIEARDTLNGLGTETFEAHQALVRIARHRTRREI
jgi:hypothetical protein